MARIETDPNYANPTFSRATAATDLFKKEDVQALANAVSTHNHTPGYGAPLTAIPSTALSVPFSIAGGVRATGESVAGWAGWGTELLYSPGNSEGNLQVYNRSTSGLPGYGKLRVVSSEIHFASTNGTQVFTSYFDVNSNLYVANGITANALNGGTGIVNIGSSGGIVGLINTSGSFLVRCGGMRLEMKDGSALAGLECTGISCTSVVSSSGGIVIMNSNLTIATNTNGVCFTDTNTRIFSASRVTYFDEYGGGWQWRNSIGTTVCAVLSGAGDFVSYGRASFNYIGIAHGSYGLSLQNANLVGSAIGFAWATWACVDHAKALNLLTDPVEAPVDTLKAIDVYKYAHVSMKHDPDQPEVAPQAVRGASGEYETSLTYGMSAKQVYEYLPELVGLGEDGEPAAIDYGRMTAVLWSACQELEARLAAVEGKVAA